MKIDNNTDAETQESVVLESTQSAQSQGAGNANYPAAILLSRLAALLGHAVPVFRFSLIEKSADGVELMQLALNERAIEMWKARFPAAEVKVIDNTNVHRADFPLLWVSTDSQRALLVRGRLSNGSYTCENELSQSIEVPAIEIAGGNLLALRPDNLHLSGEQETPQTAHDWFVYAIRKHRRVFIEAVFATFIISMIGLASSLYTMQVYDRVLPTNGYSTLWVLTAGVLIAVLLEFVMKQVRSHMVDRASKSIDLELSGVFFSKALDIRMDVRPSTVGTFASQIRHFESVRSFMTSSTLFILADVPFAFLFTFIIFMIAGPVALVPLVAVPMGIFSGLIAQGRVEKITSENMTESNRKNGLLIEAIDGIESIKAAGGEWKMLDRYRNMSATIANSDMKLKDLMARVSNITQVIQQLNYVGLIAVGAYAVTSGSLTQGGLIACSIISARAFGPFLQITNMLVQWKQAKVALKSLDSIMAMPSDRSSSQRLVVPELCNGNLRMENALFAYREDKPTLEVAEIRFKPGERVAVIGSVGSGKSTLVKMLSGLFKPKSGAVFLDDINIETLAPEYVRENIGYLPQDVRLFNGTLRENLVMGLPTPSDGMTLRAAKLTGLDQVIQNHPKGLELEIAEGGRGLSGGQRQLVGLTRLLIAQPKIMLLDEPTASMDNQLEAKLMHHFFQEIPADSILVVVTHKLGILPLFNRIIIVDKGRIVADGSRDAIMAAMKEGLSKKADKVNKRESSGVSV